MSFELHHGDCLDVMATLPDASIDCVLTDPPYNIARETNFHTMKGHRGTSMDFGDWDKGADILSFIPLLPRMLVSGANVVVFNCWENVGDIARAMRKCGIEPKRCLVLHKTNPAPFNRNRLFVNDVEFAVWGVYKGKWTFNREQPLEKCVIQTTVQAKVFHPTMKDLKVMRKLVRMLSKPGDTVLDCFSGSGSTGVACELENRNFIGIEKDAEYFKIATNRIEGVKKKEPLFAAA